MFDMGPYYLTALVNLLGAARRVSGATKITHPERLITSEPLAGMHVKVEVPTHLAGTVDFASGAIATVIMSFDVRAGHRLPMIEIYGTEGTLGVPNPNTFRGPVLLKRADDEEWSEVPLAFSDEVSRGIGVADMASAVRTGRAHRASGEVALHVLEIMQAFDVSSAAGEHVAMRTACERPAPLSEGLAAGEID
jgi:predicted dehydrogenase